MRDGKRDRVVTRNWPKKSRTAALYSRLKVRGRCRDCGSERVQIGRHPSGVSCGDVLKAFASDPWALRAWVRECGWQCPSCRQGGLGERRGEVPLPSPEMAKRVRVDAIHKELAIIKKVLLPLRKRLKKVGGPISVEMCREALGRVQKNVPKEQQESYIRGMEERGVVSGGYMDPEKYQRLLEREAALKQELSEIC